MQYTHVDFHTMNVTSINGRINNTGVKVTRAKVPGSKSSLEHSFPGAKDPGSESSTERKLQGAKGPGNESSRERIRPGKGCNSKYMTAGKGLLVSRSVAFFVVKQWPDVKRLIVFALLLMW